MAESKPEVKKEDGGTTEKTKSKSQYHQRRSNNRDHGGKRQVDRVATPRTTFKGECLELEGAYFDFSTSYRADMYENSIRLMSGYVARKYDNGDDIRITLNELKMPTLEKPDTLDSTADGVDKEIYKEDINPYAKDKRALTRNAKKLYSLDLGQCTESLRAKMKGRDNWKSMDEKSESVELLKTTKGISFIVDTGKNIYMKTWKVKRETANLFQNNDTP